VNPFSTTSRTIRSLPFGVSGALACCIRASVKVVSFDTPQPLGRPGPTHSRSQRPRARQLARADRRAARPSGSRLRPTEAHPGACWMVAMTLPNETIATGADPRCPTARRCRRSSPTAPPPASTSARGAVAGPTHASRATTRPERPPRPRSSRAPTGAPEPQSSGCLEKRPLRGPIEGLRGGAAAHPVRNAPSGTPGRGASRRQLRTLRVRGRAQRPRTGRGHQDKEGQCPPSQKARCSAPPSSRDHRPRRIQPTRRRRAGGARQAHRLRARARADPAARRAR